MLMDYRSGILKKSKDLELVYGSVSTVLYDN